MGILQGALHRIADLAHYDGVLFWQDTYRHYQTTFSGGKPMSGREHGVIWRPFR